MSYKEILNTILIILLELWKWDLSVFSNKWLYIPFCIPAIVFLFFFVIKWSAITAPIWLPFYCALNGMPKLIKITNKKGDGGE